MKAREIKELRTSAPQDLKAKLDELKAELFNLRFQLATGQLENPMRIREVKKSIAQIKTKVFSLTKSLISLFTLNLLPLLNIFISFALKLF